MKPRHLSPSHRGSFEDTTVTEHDRCGACGRLVSAVSVHRCRRTRGRTRKSRRGALTCVMPRRWRLAEWGQ